MTPMDKATDKTIAITIVVKLLFEDIAPLNGVHHRLKPTSARWVQAFVSIL